MPEPSTPNKITRRDFLGLKWLSRNTDHSNKPDAELPSKPNGRVSRRSFLKGLVLLSSAVVGKIFLKKLPFYEKQVVEEIENRRVFSVDLSQFLIEEHGQDSMALLDFTKLAERHRDIVTQVGSGYEFVVPPGGKLVLIFPNEKRISLSNNKTIPGVFIENIPPTDYSQKTKRSFDEESTAGLVCRADEVEIIGNNSTLSARGLDRGIYIEPRSQSANCTAKVADLYIIDNNPFNYNQGNLYVSAPAAITAVDTDLTVRGIVTSPLPSSSIQDSNTDIYYDASISKQSPGIVVIGTKRPVVLTVSESSIKSNWDCLSITGDTECQVIESELLQTTDGKTRCNRGAAIGVSRAFTKATIHVYKSTLDSIKGVGIFGSPEQSGIIIRDSIVSNIAWTAFGARTLDVSSTSLLFNSMDFLLAGRTNFLTSQQVAAFLESKSELTIDDLTIRIPESPFPNSFFPLISTEFDSIASIRDTHVQAKGQIRIEKFDPLAQNSTTTDSAIDHNREPLTRANITASDIIDLLRLLVTTAETIEELKNCDHFQLFFLWDNDMDTLVLLVKAVANSNIIELRLSLDNPSEQVVTTLNKQIAETMDSYVESETGKSQVFGAWWIQDGDKLFVLKMEGITSQMFLNLSTVSIDDTGKVVEDQKKTVYQTQIGEEIDFIRWSISGNGTADFEFQIKLGGLTSNSPGSWNNDTDSSDLLSDMIASFEAEATRVLDSQYETHFAAISNVSGILTKSHIAGNEPPLQPKFLYGYFDEDNQPVILLFQISNNDITKCFNGEVYRGQPGEIINNLGFSTFDSELVEFSSSLNNLHSNTVSFRWGDRGPLAKIWG